MALAELDLRESNDRADRRWYELVFLTTLWCGGLTLASAGQPSTWAPIASLLAGTVGAVATSVPLSTTAVGLRRTATARRITEAAVVGAAVGSIPILVVGPQIPPLTVLLLAAVSWVTMAVTTTLRPIAVSTEGGFPVPTDGARRATKLERLLKRLLDIVASCVLLILTAPILLITAILIRRHDHGPVFFRQERMAQGTSTFRIFKFRSMVCDAEARKDELRDLNERTGPLFKVSDDPRVTPIGRVIRELSIDELPQLINVLKGEMSLVGPRPALVDEAAVFDDQLASQRSKAKPGITGLWQVEARNDPDFGRYRSLDLYYVRNWSLGMDFRILLATGAEVLAAVAVVPLRRLGLVDVVSADGICHDDPTTGLTIDLRVGSAQHEPVAVEVDSDESIEAADVA